MLLITDRFGTFSRISSNFVFLFTFDSKPYDSLVQLYLMACGMPLPGKQTRTNVVGHEKCVLVDVSDEGYKRNIETTIYVSRTEHSIYKHWLLCIFVCYSSNSSRGENSEPMENEIHTHWIVLGQVRAFTFRFQLQKKKRSLNSDEIT